MSVIQVKAQSSVGHGRNSRDTDISLSVKVNCGYVCVSISHLQSLTARLSLDEAKAFHLLLGSEINRLTHEGS